jgi:HlyD family secretion protein
MPVMSRKWIVLGLLLLCAALLAAAGWAVWGRPAAVPAVQVQAAPLVRTLLFSARVATLSRVEVGSTVTGRVAAVRVREGQAVAADEPLLELEDDEGRAALGQAEAGVRQAAARLAGLQAGGRDVADATVAQAEAQVRAAEAEAGRARDLLAQGFIGQARLDEVERAAAVARAQRDGARAQRQALADAGSDILQARAQLALAEAGVDAARARLAQATVRAPAPGRVLGRSVEPGQIVQPGRALLTLALDGPLELLAQVDERFLEELQIGQAAAVLADAYPQQRFAAQLAHIAPRVDAQRGSIELRFALADPPDFLREDMTLSLEVTTAQRERTRVLPLAALRGGAVGSSGGAGGTGSGVAGDEVVWVASDGRVQARTVRLGLRTLAAVEVLDGVADGEQVLVGPAPAPGQRVRTTAWNPDAARPAASPAGNAGTAMGNAMGR